MDKEYFIELNGRKIPVSKEVYYAFKRPAWKERKRRQVRAEKELSLEAFADAGFEIPSGQALVDEIVEDKLLLDMLFKALSELTEMRSSAVLWPFMEEISSATKPLPDKPSTRRIAK